MIEPRAAGQRQSPQLAGDFGECARGPGLAAREAPPRRLAGDISIKFARFAVGAAGVGAEPQLDAAGNGGRSSTLPPRPCDGTLSCSDTRLALVRSGLTLAKLLIRSRHCQ